MKTKNILSTLLVVFLFVATSVAQGNIVSVDEFKTLKKANKELVVIDASKAKLYTASHVAGAISIPYKVLNQKEGVVDGLLKTPQDLAKLLGEKGISDQDEIVVYDEGSQKYSTRVYWVLKYLGATNVKLLHKEMSAWGKARIKLTSAVPSVKAKTFTPNLNDAMIADIDFVKEGVADENVVLFDARSEKEFIGSDDVKKKYSEGHLPGAVHLEFKDVLNENKSFMNAEAFADKGYTADKTYIMYCKTGVKASVLYVYFSEILGFENVKVYEGAYLEWAAQGETIEK